MSPNTKLPLDHIQNIEMLRQAAKAQLEERNWGYLEGGSEDELTLAENRNAFQRVEIRPRRLVDVRDIDMQTHLWGWDMKSPLVLAPVGFQQVFHPEGELATARAAAKANTPMVVSTVANASVTEVAAASTQIPWFQLYPTPNRKVTQGLLQRAEQAGSTVVMLTVDCPVVGNRETDSGLIHEVLDGGKMRMGNFEGIRDRELISDPSMDWSMISWLKAACSMKVVIKGVVTAEDALLCVEHGADGVVVSNHGGRQLDGAVATLTALPEVAEAIAGRMPVLFDGGIRRGTEVFKALALGADAVCIGRAFCYGLAAFGEEGVVKALEILNRELHDVMQLAGTPNLKAIGAANVRRRP